MDLLPTEVICKILYYTKNKNIITLLSSCNTLYKLKSTVYFKYYVSKNIFYCKSTNNIDKLLILSKNHPYNNKPILEQCDKSLYNDYLNYIINEYVGTYIIDHESYDMYQIFLFLSFLYPIETYDDIIHDYGFSIISPYIYQPHYIIQIFERTLILKYDEVKIIKLMKCWRMHYCWNNRNYTRNGSVHYCDCDHISFYDFIFMDCIDNYKKNKNGYEVLIENFTDLLIKYNRSDIYKHFGKDTNITSNIENDELYSEYLTNEGEPTNGFIITPNLLLSSSQPRKLLHRYLHQFMNNEHFAMGYNGICNLYHLKWGGKYYIYNDDFISLTQIDKFDDPLYIRNENNIIGYLLSGKINEETMIKLLRNNKFKEFVGENYIFILNIADEILVKYIILNKSYEYNVKSLMKTYPQQNKIIMKHIRKYADVEYQDGLYNYLDFKYIYNSYYAICDSGDIDLLYNFLNS
ncbi:Hypothetical protein ORPV_502 [Orpheovirus IHUMI-LCC2]|uniref:F-box domain-containing protein n=1 Tax=Orpheovirus IHUMI-LCC2 TaxID=2023057 RepID=A0A2I2L4E0_9VIRU|nr:Hypothetical protein ORPV_502 [Orpheovirus IHUMI-LCC2]SNW62406.1 Hypothetical protein ORPV_502 [Orpheovirus IHUMI-LCC2]